MIHYLPPMQFSLKDKVMDPNINATPTKSNEDKVQAISVEFDTLCVGKQKAYSFNLFDSKRSANPTFGDLIRNIKKQLYDSINAIEKKSGKIVEQFSVGKSHAEQLKKGQTSLYFNPTDKNTWRLASGVNVKWSSYVKNAYDGLVTLCALTEESINEDQPSKDTPPQVHDFTAKVCTSLVSELEKIEQKRFAYKDCKGGYKEGTYAGVIFFVYKFQKQDDRDSEQCNSKQAGSSQTKKTARFPDDTESEDPIGPLLKKPKLEYGEDDAISCKQRAMVAKRILKQGCMPLVPPSRRDWENQDQILLPCGIKWPPKNWEDMSLDTRRLLLEYTAMKLESIRLKTDLPTTNRRELLEKYNFLALNGSQLPKPTCELGNVRYYNYETLRGIFNNPQDLDADKEKFLYMMQTIRCQRDTSTDNMLDMIDDVPVKLDEYL